jgi:hypothetical protein
MANSIWARVPYHLPVKLRSDFNIPEVATVLDFAWSAKVDSASEALSLLIVAITSVRAVLCCTRISVERSSSSIGHSCSVEAF